MRSHLFLFLVAALTLQAFGQSSAPTTPTQGLPKDPRAILEAAAPLYDFNDPSLKPWHLKASYQLYDEKGNPDERGTFEYWWASPKINRVTWTRPGITHTEWSTGEGKRTFLNTGGPLRYYEYKLKGALLSPMPDASEYEKESVRLEREDRPVGSFKIACIMIDPPMPQKAGQLQVSPLGLFSTYCFDPQTPALRVTFSFGSVSTVYSKIVKVQGRFLGRELIFFDGKRRLLSASVDTIEGLDASDAALTPPPEATVAKFGTVGVSAGVMVGQLLKKQQPIYPQDAKEARASGTVVIKATIGTDGSIHELHVVSAPWPSLAVAALSAVSQWQYKPYMLNDEPVQVLTTINVIFTLGR